MLEGVLNVQSAVTEEVIASVEALLKVDTEQQKRRYSMHFPMVFACTHTHTHRQARTQTHTHVCI